MQHRHDEMHEIWCLVEGANIPFPVVTSSDIFISELKEMIGDKNRFPQTVDAMDLILWKPREIVPVKPPATLAQRLKALGDIRQFSGMADPADKVGDVFQGQRPASPHLDIFIQIPASATAGGGVAEENSVLDSELFKEYQDAFIIVNNWGSFQLSDIDLNDVRSVTLVPNFVEENFVTKFERKLDRRPGVASNVMHPMFTLISGPQTRAAYCESSRDSTDIDMENPNEEESQPLRDVKLTEGMHMSHLACLQWETTWGRSSLNGPLMNEIFFRMIAMSVLDKDDKDTVTIQLGKAPWPFNLVTKRADVQFTELRMYRPCSAFLILKSFLPRLLVEVNSTSTKSWPEDLIRMLLQGAAIVRFANTFLNTFKAKNFVLVAIFVHDDGKATRYFLFQRQNDRTVFYKETVFDLNTPVGRVEFARQIYNLLYTPGADEAVSDTEFKVALLREKISNHKEDFGMKSFYTSEDGQETSRKRPGAYEAYCAELPTCGYEVQPEAIVNASGITFESLFKMPTHILTVFRPSDSGKKLIAKKVCEESNELMILNLLNTTQPQSIHVVRLLDSFHTQSGLWIIMPKMDTITDYLRIAPKQLSNKVHRLCEGLIEGLGYLHGLSIAHRDIKPNNLLVDQTFCLKIIDFDIALQVKDEDEEVDDECGTENWMAPEIEKRPTYSPIKADRWSCGRVILYLLDKFKKEDKHLRPFANKLTAHDPKRRPSLLEWASSSDAAFSDVANAWEVGERKML